MSTTTWIKCSDRMPPENRFVITKIDDEAGPRNVEELKLVGGKFWFGFDGMYVYYTPTHWHF